VKPRSSLVSVALLAALASPPALLAAVQDPPPAPQEPPPGEKPPPAERPIVRRLEAWPALDGKARETVRVDVERLRKARTDEMADQARDALVQAGSAIVPELLPVVGKEKDPHALQRVLGVLETVTGPEHTRLLAAEFEDRSLPVRTWAMRRCGQFPDEGVRKAAGEALARARKGGDKADREELYAAALCTTAAGSREGLDVIADWAVDGWGKRGVEMRTALEAVRSPEAAAEAAKLLLQDDRKKTVAGLNLLAGCGDPGAIQRVKPYLDNTDNSIRVAAINAMRGIVDGDPPIANLAVFEAIELAKKWKAR
jgi:hypothetical protein